MSLWSAIENLKNVYLVKLIYISCSSLGQSCSHLGLGRRWFIFVSSCDYREKDFLSFSFESGCGLNVAWVASGFVFSDSLFLILVLHSLSEHPGKIGKIFTVQCSKWWKLIFNHNGQSLAFIKKWHIFDRFLVVSAIICFYTMIFSLLSQK